MSHPAFVPLRSFEIGEGVISDPSFFHLDTRGVIVVDVFALLSSAALVSVACRVIWLAVLQRISSRIFKPKEYVFFNTQLGYYAVCLLIGNLLTDVSGLIGLQWLLDGGITTKGSLCIVQAVLMQTGNWANAYFTVAMAVHTFNSLVMQVRQYGIVSMIAITVGWISAGLIAAGPFISPQEQSISGPIYGFFYHLFPIFAASVLSAILYSVIFLVLRGTLNIKGGVRLTLDPHERWSSGKIAENYHRFVARIARSMLWYPFAYIALLIPYSVTRLLSISGFKVPSEALIFAYTCWFMLGVVNVALLYNTFRVLGPALDPPSQKESPMGYDSAQGHWTSRKSYLTPSFRSPTTASFGLQPTVRPLLSVHQERSASVKSYYSYPSSPSVSIGREITPVNELTLQCSVTPPKAVAQKFSPATPRSLGLHSRQDSAESMGLPAAPRRTRSPVLHDHSVEQMHIVQGGWSPADVPEHSVQRPTSAAQTFDKRDSASSCYSCDSAEYDSTNWESRSLGQNGHSMSSTLNTSSGLSLVSPGSSRLLPSPTRHNRSFSAAPPLSPSPTGRQPSAETRVD